MNSSDSLCIPGAWHSSDSAIQLPTAGSVLPNTPDTWLHAVLLLQEDANLTEQRWSRGSQHAHANQPWDVCESQSSAGQKGIAESSSELSGKT